MLSQEFVTAYINKGIESGIIKPKTYCLNVEEPERKNQKRKCAVWTELQPNSLVLAHGKSIKQILEHTKRHKKQYCSLCDRVDKRKWAQHAAAHGDSRERQRKQKKDSAAKKAAELKELKEKVEQQQEALEALKQQAAVFKAAAGLHQLSACQSNGAQNNRRII